MAKKSRSLTGIFILVVVLFLVLGLFTFYSMKTLSDGSQDNFNSKNDYSIAVIEIQGVIMEARKTIELLDVALKDKDTKAIILRINSPGGAVAPTQEIYQEVRRIDELYDTSKGKKGKPVYASFSSIAASGGYYIGAATRKIFASPGTLTGSIGVIMQFMDLSKIYEMAKVKVNNIAAGKYKDIGSTHRPMKVDEKSLLDSMAHGVHEQFVDDILKMRKRKIKGDIWDHAQGQIFSGAAAKEIGLVDELKGLWEGGRMVHNELKIKKDFGLKFIKKKKRMKVWDFLENLEEVSSSIKRIITFNDSIIPMFKL